MFQQGCYRRLTTDRRRREMESGDPATRCRGIRVTPRSQEQPHHLAVPPLCREMQREISADTGACVHIGTPFDQRTGHRGISLLRSPVQRTHAIAFRCIDVGTTGNERRDRLHIALARGLHDRIHSQEEI